MESPEKDSPYHWAESAAASSGTADKEMNRVYKQRKRRVRMIFCVLAAVLPIVMISFLVSHLDMINMWRNKWKDPAAASMVETDSLITMNNNAGSDREDYSPVDEDATVCAPIPFKTSEVLDAEERDIFRGIRTSFLPTQSVVYPPGCLEGLSQREVTDVKREEFDPQDMISQLLNFFLRRPRREVVEMSITESSQLTKTTLGHDVDDNATTISMSTEVDSSAIDTTTTADNWTEDIEPVQNISINSFWTEESDFDKVRETQAAIMKRYMDATVDPCEDFYQYACGNWEALNPIPKDRAAYDTFEILRESLDLVLRDLLENSASDDDEVEEMMTSSTTESDSEEMSASPTTEEFTNDLLDVLIANGSNPESNSAERKAIDLFTSCMNYEILEGRGLEPLMNLLGDLGGWPVLNADWNEEGFNWIELTAKLRLFNNDIFIVEWVAPDIKNSQENIIQFDQTSLGLPTRDYFLQSSNADYLEAYREYMAEVIHLLGVEKGQATISASEIVDFEKELAKITQTPEERTNVSLLYRRMTVGELHRQVPEIDWTLYLEIVLQRDVNRTERVVMFALNFMQDLVKLINKTEKHTVANYLLWRFVRHRVNNLDDRFIHAKQRFYFVLFGREQSPPRWKACVNQVNSNLGMAVGSMFVRKYFDELSKQDTLTMTYELQDAFREILNGTDWIDNATKALAGDKVNAMSLRIGYPDYILDQADLDDKYRGLEIHPEKYFENTLNVLKYMTKYEHDKLSEVVNKTAWHTAPAVVNAYYSRNKNQIMFPAGILQPPFYHKYFPKSLNYGGIGVVIGHELTHGFDDKGRLFDYNGNLLRWWSDSAISNFHDRARCLIMQYGNYSIVDVGSIDGVSTQGENIADNGGIKQAFKAYKKWLSSQEDITNEVLPGLNCTSGQLFFLNFAQIWCGAMRPEATKNKLKTAVHSPGRYRVIGTLTNSDDFAEEFNCPVGSPMNPASKCTVW